MNRLSSQYMNCNTSFQILWVLISG